MVDYQGEVAAIAKKYPEAWKNAHTGGPGTEDFIRLLASHLFVLSGELVGLNGKRGNPDDISDDALAVYDVNGDVTDRTGKKMFIVDCIGGAGGPNPTPQWGSVGGPSPGAWVKPAPQGGVVVPPPVKPFCPDITVHSKPLCPDVKAHDPKPVYPKDESVWDEVFERLQADMRKKGQELNPQSARWAARTMYRTLVQGMEFKESVAKSEREWREILG